MKNLSCTIYYGNEVPNIPVLKNNLQKLLTEAELNYAKRIANKFLTTTLISKTFFDARSIAEYVKISRKFSIFNNPKITIKKEIIEYATLLIFGNLFINDSCPDTLDITLKYDKTEGLVSDAALQQFVKGTPTDIYEITLSTRVSRIL